MSGAKRVVRRLWRSCERLQFDLLFDLFCAWTDLQEHPQGPIGYGNWGGQSNHGRSSRWNARRRLWRPCSGITTQMHTTAYCIIRNVFVCHGFLVQASWKTMAGVSVEIFATCTQIGFVLWLGANRRQKLFQRCLRQFRFFNVHATSCIFCIDLLSTPRQLNWARLTLCKALCFFCFCHLQVWGSPFEGVPLCVRLSMQAIGGSASGVGPGAFQKGKRSKDWKGRGKCLLNFVGYIKIQTFHGCLVWVS